MLDESFGIEWGLLTTVHAATSSQAILDGFSKKSKRLGRGLMGNLIPTSTGASEAVQLVYPALAGKFKGRSGGKGFWLRVTQLTTTSLDVQGCHFVYLSATCRYATSPSLSPNRPPLTCPTPPCR